MSLWELRRTRVAGRLYLDNAYLRSCSATVLARYEGCVELDRTVFCGHGHDYGHPQVSDRGFVRFEGRSLRVKRVDATRGRLLHYVEGKPLPARGARVRCDLDMRKRRVVMRLHTAAHAVLAIAEPEFDLRPRLVASRSPEVDTASATVYFEKGGLTRDVAADLASAVNHAMAGARPVATRWIPRAEAEARTDAGRLRITRIPAWHDPLRFVRIEGLVELPCDGTLVANTREVRRVEVQEVRPMRLVDKLVLALEDLPLPRLPGPAG